MEQPKYLVRPNDFHIFDLDESNNCYRSWSTREVTYEDGTRPQAMSHFTFENLTKNYGFFPIEENEIEIYDKKNKEYHEFLSWQNRSDGHGGIKGGTYEEFLQKKKDVKLPEGWKAWNTLSLDQMVEYLRKKYMYSSSGDAKCIYHLIEFYDKHK